MALTVENTFVLIVFGREIEVGKITVENYLHDTTHSVYFMYSFFGRFSHCFKNIYV